MSAKTSDIMVCGSHCGPPFLIVGIRFSSSLARFATISHRYIDSSRRQCEWCPPGHGDLYAALEGSGTLDKLLEQGVKYMFVSNSDNLGATMDLDLLSYFAKQDYRLAKSHRVASIIITTKIATATTNNSNSNISKTQHQRQIAA
jgi:hypothetical protein